MLLSNINSTARRSVRRSEGGLFLRILLGRKAGKLFFDLAVAMNDVLATTAAIVSGRCFISVTGFLSSGKASFEFKLMGFKMAFPTISLSIESQFVTTEANEVHFMFLSVKCHSGPKKTVE